MCGSVGCLSESVGCVSGSVGCLSGSVRCVSGSAGCGKRPLKWFVYYEPALSVSQKLTKQMSLFLE